MPRRIPQVGKVPPGDFDVRLHGDIVVGVLDMVVGIRLQRSTPGSKCAPEYGHL